MKTTAINSKRSTRAPKSAAVKSELSSVKTFTANQRKKAKAEISSWIAAYNTSTGAADKYHGLITDTIRAVLDKLDLTQTPIDAAPLANFYILHFGQIAPTSDIVAGFYKSFDTIKSRIAKELGVKISVKRTRNTKQADAGEAVGFVFESVTVEAVREPSKKEAAAKKRAAAVKAAEAAGIDLEKIEAENKRLKAEGKHLSTCTQAELMAVFAGVLEYASDKTKAAMLAGLMADAKKDNKPAPTMDVPSKKAVTH